MSKISPAQEAMLRRIVKTNGGGIHQYGLHGPTMRALYGKGLIQGKAGQQTCAVHTREGLALIRELDAKQP